MPASSFALRASGSLLRRFLGGVGARLRCATLRVGICAGLAMSSQAAVAAATATSSSPRDASLPSVPGAAVSASPAATPLASATTTATPPLFDYFGLRPLFGSTTVYIENDKFFAGTDEGYTQGLRITLLTDNLQSFHPRKGFVWGGLADSLLQLLGPRRKNYDVVRAGIAVGQNIYTPVDIDTPLFQPNDRPYAGWLYAGWLFQFVTDRPESTPRTATFEVTTGLMGRASLAGWTQNRWHELWGWDPARGWDHQLRSEPGLNLVWENKQRHRWHAQPERADAASSGFAIDFLPHWGASLGTVQTYLNAGFEVRAGWDLPRDFGSSLIRPSSDGALATVARAPRLHVFFGADARLVGRDAFLDGNLFHDSHSVDKRPLVADWQGGFAITLGRWKTTYSQAARSLEFYGQRSRHVFGSISITYSRPLGKR